MSSPLGIVLAGGRSSRMGEDKATILWQGTPLYLHQLAVLRSAGLSELAISHHPSQSWPSSLPAEIARFPDPPGGRSPLHAIASLLDRACDTSADRLLVLPVDMPLAAPLLAPLLASPTPATFVLDGRPVPFPSLLSPALLPLARSHIEAGTLSLTGWLSAAFDLGLATPLSPPDHHPDAFTNLNRPSDLPPQP